MSDNFEKKQFDREKVKKRGFKRFLNSFKFSFQGFVYAYKYEQSVLIHLICSICALIAGIVLQISIIEWLMVIISLGMLLVIEFLNTAIEATVDMITLEYNPLAKIAKDTGSAAEFTMIFLAILVGIYVFVPKILEFL